MKILYNWLLNHWKILLITVAVLISIWQFFVYKTSYDKILDEYNKRDTDFKNELQQIKDVNEQWHRQEEDLFKTYNDQLQQIDQKYEQQLQEINKKQVIQQKKIVVDAEQDPKTLLNKVQNSFGIPIAE